MLGLSSAIKNRKPPHKYNPDPSDWQTLKRSTTFSISKVVGTLVHCWVLGVQVGVNSEKDNFDSINIMLVPINPAITLLEVCL